MKKALKWLGLILVGLVAIIILGGIVITSVGDSKANEQFEVTNTLLSEISEDSASVAYGAHLAKIHACADCHTDSFGGKVFVDAPPFLVVATNLTSGKGGVGSTYSIQDWDRAIRYGVKPDGSANIIMPSKTLHNLSDDDTRALIAYLKSVPPVDNELPITELRALGKILVAAGEFDPANEVHLESNRRDALEAGVTKEYGKYLASITCIYCHGDNLEGGPALGSDSPPPTSLRPASQWPLAQFKTAMRTGVTPAQHQMDPKDMPWTAYENMTDDELEAIHLHLQSL